MESNFPFVALFSLQLITYDLVWKKKAIEIFAILYFL